MTDLHTAVTIIPGAPAVHALDAIDYLPGTQCHACDPLDPGCDECTVEADYCVRVRVGALCPGPSRGNTCGGLARLRTGAYELASGVAVCLDCAASVCCDGEDDAELERVRQALADMAPSEERAS